MRGMKPGEAMSDIGGAAADERAAKRTNNIVILTRYREKLARVQKRRRPALRRLVLATAAVKRQSDEENYLSKQIEKIRQAMEIGEDFRKPKRTKPRLTKGMRKLELE